MTKRTRREIDIERGTDYKTNRAASEAERDYVISQGEACFACGRQFRENGHGRIVFHPTALTIDGQRPFVGHDCYRRIVDAGVDGWQPPKGGPRLWCEYEAPEEARKAAGILLVRGSRAAEVARG